jgi:hypothetical protein
MENQAKLHARLLAQPVLSIQQLDRLPFEKAGRTPFSYSENQLCRPSLPGGTACCGIGLRREGPLHFV